MKRLSLVLAALFTLGMVTSLLAADVTGGQVGVFSVKTPPLADANLGIETSVQATTPVASGTHSGAIRDTHYPPGHVQAEIVDTNVNVTWRRAAEWLHYDSGTNYASIGTGIPSNFDVAIRFPASALTEYAGMKLYAIKAWLAQAGTYRIRVWKGGDASAPAQLVVDQLFTPQIDAYNTVFLNAPVAITGTEELWFGYKCVVNGGYPAGCDEGPAIEGFGNMIYYEGAWDTLHNLASLNYNWNIQGFVDNSAAGNAPGITPITLNGSEFDRSQELYSELDGYRVWRLPAGQENSEDDWDLLTLNSTVETSFVDTTWQSQPAGLYKYAVKAVYSDNALSAPAFSNPLASISMGTFTGTVKDRMTNLPLEGVTIITTGAYTCFTDANGKYAIAMSPGSYSVIYSKPGYQSVTQYGVVITASQTTLKDINLTEATYPPVQLVAEEAGNYVNLSWVPSSHDPIIIMEGFETNAFPPADWSQIINNTNVMPSGITATWQKMGRISQLIYNNPRSGSGQAVLWGDNDHQDEWLITPQFTCYPNAILRFWSFVYLGDTHGDHFYVKASTDDGNTWTVLWDSAAQPSGVNRYQTSINIPLDSLAGQSVKLAFHALSPPDSGIYYLWLIDDVTINMPGSVLRFPMSDFATCSSGMEDGGKERGFLGYRIWRFPVEYQDQESRWTSLTPYPIIVNSFTDTQWHNLPNDDYKWAVKTIYTGNLASIPTFSNALTKINHIGTITGTVRDQKGNPVYRAFVMGSQTSAFTNSDGVYSMQAASGTHTLSIIHPDNGQVIIENVVVVTDQTTTVDIIMPPSLAGFADGFESYEDFVIQFLPWTLVDVDQSTTYGITNTTWENAHAPQSFIIFTPSATIPPLQNAQPHGGDKVAACFAAVDGPNNDWLITPEIKFTNEFRFWARSYNAEHGLERFRVGISSTGTNPNNFHFISGDDYIEAPEEWTEYIYDLTGYFEQRIYIAINCVSENGSFLMVDDIYVHHATDADDPSAPVLATTLNANYPNPFNPETTITYSLQDTTPVTIEIYNIKGQLVKTLVNDHKAAGNHSVVWNGTDNSNRNVSSGVYYYKMRAGKYSSTRKMILMK